MIDLQRYVNALANVSDEEGCVPVKAALVALQLALNDGTPTLAPAPAPTQMDDCWERAQFNGMLAWIDDNGFAEIYRECGEMVGTMTTIVSNCRKLSAGLVASVKERDVEIQRLRASIADQDAESYRMRQDLLDARQTINVRDGQASGMVDTITAVNEDNAQLRVTNNRLESMEVLANNRIGELTAQLEAANSRLLTLAVQAGPAASLNGVNDYVVDNPLFADGAKSDPAVFGINGREISDLEVAATGVVVDWDGLPTEYATSVDSLIRGETSWSHLPVSERRAIALHALDYLACDGRLTMAQFAENKPPFMPAGNAIAQMFGLRWSEVVANAVRYAGAVRRAGL